MSTVVNESPKLEAASRSLAPDGNALLLRGVTWEEYLGFRDNPENDGVRMYYSEGGLLLMTTGPLHEAISSLLGLILFDWAQEEDIPVRCFGRWTMRQDLDRKGLEADNCYYISSLPKVRGKQMLDLTADPPPDLAIEVDVTTHSEHKFEIYSALGVAELWVWRGNSIQVYRLQEQRYVAVDGSVELPQFRLAEAAAAILEFHDQDDLKVVRAFRERTGRN